MGTHQMGHYRIVKVPLQDKGPLWGMNKVRANNDHLSTTAFRVRWVRVTSSLCR
ncbi:hypothetical protein BDI24065_06106 [Burkholderia diffusa]|uniref:Uncharacterized protein n=2 Tax=Burkholderia cepacia complex TaxID=87882 RepID=A0A6P2NRA8_BURL3|nr:hypothetical protein BLA23254_04613 [Burkholderia lata]VWC25745.1 hypothetical protein BDI24065_06106 [Burkholderia diffusa]